MGDADNIFQVVAPVPYYADITTWTRLENLAITAHVKRGAVGHLPAQPLGEPVRWRVGLGYGVV